MAFTVKIVVTPAKGGPGTETTHETAVKDYLDGQSITTLHSVTTEIRFGFWMTTIVFE